MQAAPWQSPGENARDRYVFWSMRSSRPDRRFISFILQLQAVEEMYKTCNQLHKNSMIKFFVLDGLSSSVVAVSPDAAPDSAFAPSFSARPSGPLLSPIIRCPTRRAR